MTLRDETPVRVVRDVLTQQLAGELVVVNVRMNKAHCLNAEAAFVWEQCDGETTVAEIARRVERQWGHEDGWGVTQLAIRQLADAKLLERRPLLDRAVTRRTFVAKAASAAVGVPVIVSVLTPTPVHAQSCGVKNAKCGPGLPPCCPGLVCHPSGKCK